MTGPVDYANVAVARGRTMTCVQHGLFLLRDGERPLAVLVNGPTRFGEMPQVSVEVMSPEPRAATTFLAGLREDMHHHNVYRGQVLALGNPHGPFGHGGEMVEFPAFPEIDRDSVVLLERIERHTIRFSEHAEKLLAAGHAPGSLDALGCPRAPHQPGNGELHVSDAIGERELRPTLAREGAAPFREPIVLAAQEHHPIPAGSTPEDDVIRKLQFRNTLHVNPLPIPLRAQVRTSARHAHRQPP